MTHPVAYAVPLCLMLFVVQVSAADPVDFAASLIGRPYAWGAEGPRSFDCSGLTQYVYQRFGVELPRRAISQSHAGDPAGRRLERGDLVFFSTDARRSLVTHVGIYEGAGMMIEASKRYGRVRRSSLDDEYWADRFMFARRVSEGDYYPESARIPDRPPARRGGDRSRAAVRVLETLADVFLKRPR